MKGVAHVTLKIQITDALNKNSRDVQYNMDVALSCGAE